MNMGQQFSMEELHTLLLDMLMSIDAFCRKNNIRYSLGGGTLLGAIRHKGFIPWDDDVDIMMPRPDYDRFRKEFNGFDSRYECIYCEKTKTADYVSSYAKVHDVRTILIEKKYKIENKCGVNIDVFPVDGLPNNLKLCEFYLSIIAQFCHIVKVRNCKLKNAETITEAVKIMIGKLLPGSIWGKIMDKVLSIYNFESSIYAGAVTGRYGMKEVYKREMFEDYIDVQFEGKMFRSVFDYHLYLTQHYGDYMKIPDEKDRINHCSVAWWVK